MSRQRLASVGTAPVTACQVWRRWFGSGDVVLSGSLPLWSAAKGQFGVPSAGGLLPSEVHLWAVYLVNRIGEGRLEDRDL
jgi:hypothetical protein